MVKESSLPDYVKVSTFLFTEEYERSIGEKVRGVIFNKFMTLLNHDFKNTKNIDIKLPHNWYRWGDEVVKYYVKPYTKWDHEDLGTTTVSWKGGVPDFNLDDPVVVEIRKYIKSHIEKYSNEDGWERAIDALYAKAPYPFQNEYRKLRENLKGAATRPIYIQDYISSLLIPLFNNAMNAFPNAFSEIKKEKLDFESVFRLAAESGSSIDDLRDMVERFWFFFCYYLRVDKKCHENISNETLEVWRSSIPWEKEMYIRSLQDIAYNLQLKGKEKRIDHLLKEREERVNEFNDILDEFRDADKKIEM
jgi:hypothetical protein